MNRQELYEAMVAQKSFLCVGLDTDLAKIPPHLLGEKDPIFEFNKQIIDATQDHCVAYKPNLAFYEALGTKGWESLEKTLNHIPKTHFTIADAKRGDIGNTSKLYAKAFFETLNFDAVTVAPYMGVDSVQPFLEFDGKWVILLGLTSNVGSLDFQTLRTESGAKIYETVLEKAQKWGTTDNLMFVVGATHPHAFAEIRSIVPEHFLLVPGVGAQGGDLMAVAQNGWNSHGGLLINSSRGILYASDGEDFALQAKTAAQMLQTEMSLFFENNHAEE